MDRLSEEELEEWRQIIQTFPSAEREKWRILVKSGRLLSLVVFLDSVTNTMEKFGAFGVWLNKIVKGFFYIVAVGLLLRFVITGEIEVSDLWKLFAK